MVRRKRHYQLTGKLLSTKLGHFRYLVNELSPIPIMMATKYESDIMLKDLGILFITSSQQSYEVSIVIAPN